MDGYIVQGGIGMARGSFVRIDDGKGVRLYVWDGELYITQEGDPRDYFIKAGESFQVDRGGVTLACARRHSRVTFTAPRVLYDRPQEPGGKSYGLFSRPTNAAL